MSSSFDEETCSLMAFQTDRGNLPSEFKDSNVMHADAVNSLSVAFTRLRLCVGM